MNILEVSNIKESFSVKNLGPLKDIHIDNIKPLTIFIGESGSGKSLLMKTLIFFRFYFKMINIRWYLKNSNVKKNLFKLKISNLLSPELLHYFKNKQLEIVYSVTVNGHSHSVIYRNGEIDRRSISSPIPNEDLIFLKESWISELRNFIPQWIELGKIPKSGAIDFYFQETFSDFQEASKINESIPLDYLNLSLDIIKKNGLKKYLITPTNHSYPPIEWKYSSSGVQTSSSIITITDYFARNFSFRDAIGRSILNYLHAIDSLTAYKPQLEPMEMKKLIHLHIEEPELNLFPTAQCRLMEDLIKTAFHNNKEDRELKVMIATHSPYIINILNVLINRSPSNPTYLNIENLDVFRIYQGKLQPLIAQDITNNRKFVESYDLTEEMANILEEYKNLTSL